MRVLLANPRGFCAGVTMAIDCLDLTLRHLGPPIYVYHEIVHNRRVVEEFTSRGAVFVDDVEDVPFDSVLVFSAHGVSPSVRCTAHLRRLRVVDATCPLVAKVHAEAIRFAQQGYEIVLIGHRGHDEVQGVLGEAASFSLVGKLEDVDRLDIARDDKVAWLSQTTLSVDETSQIVRRLTERFPQIVGPASDDICYATQNRQHALRSALDNADIVLVVGSQNSSNSRRLTELSASQGTIAHLIDDCSQLKADWFSGEETVVITAGASAPEDTVQEVVESLRAAYGAEVRELAGAQENRVFPLPVEVRSFDREGESMRAKSNHE